MRGLARFALAIVCGVSPVAADALPGQPIATFQTWAHGKKPFRTLQRLPANDVTPNPQFGVDDRDGGVAWRILTETDGKRVTDERVSIFLAVGGRPIPINREGSGPGYAMLVRAFGKDVAADYAAAVPAGSYVVGDASRPVPTDFFKGARFGYVVSNAPDGIELTIATKTVFAKTMAAAVTCAKRPASCGG